MLNYVLTVIEKVMVQPGYIDEKEFNSMKTEASMESTDIRIRTVNITDRIIDLYSHLDESVKQKLSHEMDAILFSLDKIFTNHITQNFIHDMRIFMTQMHQNIFDQYAFIPVYRKLFKDPIVTFDQLPTFVGLSKDNIKVYRCLLKEEITSEMRIQILNNSKIFSNKFKIYFVSPKRLTEIRSEYNKTDNRMKLNKNYEKILISCIRSLREKNLLTKKQFSTFRGMIRHGYIDNPKRFINKTYRAYFWRMNTLVERLPDKKCQFNTTYLMNDNAVYLYINSDAEKCLTLMRGSLDDPILKEKVNEKLNSLHCIPHFTDILSCYKNTLAEILDEFLKANNKFDEIYYEMKEVLDKPFEKIDVSYYTGFGELPPDIKELFKEEDIYDTMEFDLYDIQMNILKESK